MTGQVSSRRSRHDAGEGASPAWRSWPRPSAPDAQVSATAITVKGRPAAELSLRYGLGGVWAAGPGAQGGGPGRRGFGGGRVPVSLAGFGEQGERLGFADSCAHLGEGGGGLPGRGGRLDGVAAGQGQFAEPEQGPGGGQR